MDRDTFYRDTFADFARCDRPSSEPDYISGSLSMYWYLEDGVVRESDHWGYGVASCDWMLDGEAYGYGMHMRPDPSAFGGWSPDETHHRQYVETEPVCGFCKWGDFLVKSPLQTTLY